MTYFKKRIIALSCAAKVGNVSDTNEFVPQMDQITDKDSFNDKFENAI